ncbi:SUMF1/EgtB/PvdO family nonheme iron enzyme [Leucobacter sp. NPDC077196]|uniref:SUMF1/EgtB/PvdO family nonheme iron enzyme n=1 Tax=Leucobacter sp. NPDC077196 TaxID=3154959 RepID=UPI00343276F0
MGSRRGHVDDNESNAKRGFTIVELLIVVVVIAVLAAITIVAYSGITNQAKASAKAQDIAQWKKKSELRKVEKGISCPEGYVFIYGNSALGTNDFCVMKYEAKNIGGVATSQADGTPWVSITQTDAIAAATASGGHLITEAEWMTIAADVLSVKYNWSGGAVGSGYVYQGHVNNNPGSALAASADDSDGLFGITGGTGTTVGRNSQRTLLLSSGDTIWDFSGNVYEWTQQAIGTPTLTTSQIGVSGDSNWIWREWNLGSLSMGNLGSNSRPSALTSTAGLSDIASWDASKGIGRVYANYADASARAFRRGGSWGNTSDAGVLALALDTSATNAGTAVGFRVAR